MKEAKPLEQVEEQPLYVLQNAYNELVERRRELELAEEELLQEIMYRLHQGDAPMDDVAE